MKYFCFSCPSIHKPVVLLLRLMQRRVGGGGGDENSLICHGNVPMATHSSQRKLKWLCVCVCVSLVLPCLAHRQDVGGVVGGDLQACASRFIGRTLSRKRYVMTPEQMRFTQVCVRAEESGARRGPLSGLCKASS